MSDLKLWTNRFKGLGNVSRLRIIELLSKERELPVHEIARKIHVTLGGTSKHLQQLVHLGILDREGKMGQVFYSLSRDMPVEIQAILKHPLK